MAIRVVIIYQRLAALLGEEYGRGVHSFDHILGGIYCCFVKYGVTLTRCYNDVYAIVFRKYGILSLCPDSV